ncbi:MAG: hypothetical protein V2I37_06775 [Marinilabiliaceae bacterium]|jgi:hypothetical protein|nr:hypothetical protein [Marinilabiliaceae bacterium]
MLTLIYAIVIAGVIAIVLLIAKNAKAQDNNQKNNISNTSVDSQNKVKSESYPAWFGEMEKEREEEFALKEEKKVADPAEKVAAEYESQEELVAENVVKATADIQTEEVPGPKVETTERKVPENKNFLNELDSVSIELITDKLYKLSELEKQGLITKDDLEKAKAKLLSGAS